MALPSKKETQCTAYGCTAHAYDLASGRCQWCGEQVVPGHEERIAALEARLGPPELDKVSRQELKELIAAGADVRALLAKRVETESAIAEAWKEAASVARRGLSHDWKPFNDAYDDALRLEKEST